MPTIQVTAVQSNIVWLDKHSNLANLESLVGSINKTDLIVFPETFATGFAVTEPECIEPKVGGDVVDWMTRLASLKGCAICGSVLVEDGDKKVNRFYWVTADGNVEFYDKRHLFRMAGEDTYINPGQQRKIVELKGFRIMLNTCYDLRFPVWSRNQQDYDLLINVANWPVPRRNAWDTLLKARAIENQSFVVGVNRIGEDGKGVNHSGGTAIIDFLGSEIVVAEDNESAVIQAELDLNALNDFRLKFPFQADADKFQLLD
ncbi:amidohydrolase [Aliikangiella marina]|uniref:Omega-amidase YafV n=1 Tax=Aliikangiella marina TaxID=1712262 RepID=A0A545TIB3_9GAMM|nr:amidohydrolase [Aliikangiella marina]TQV76969.1 amidohydrolase [Aliikangiella marina]